MPPTYPHTPTRSEPNEIGGISYLDAYQWLEDGASEDVLAWDKAQNTLTEGMIRSWGGYEDLRELVASFAVDTAVLPPSRHGDRWFRQHTPDDRPLAVAEIADAPDGPWRTLVDLNLRSTGVTLSLRVIPSPDGRLAVLLLTEAGREEPHLQVIDIDSGEVVLDGVPQRRVMLVVWLADASGFLYTAEISDDSFHYGVYRHLLGEERPRTPELSDLPHPVPMPEVSADGRHAVCNVDHLRIRPHLVTSLQADEPVWRAFITDDAHLYKGEIIGDAFVCVTDHGAERGRLVSIPLDAGDDPSAWTELVAGSEVVLASVNHVGGRLVLAELVDTIARLRMLDLDGTERGVVALPGQGTVSPSGFGMLIMGMQDAVVPCAAPQGSTQPDAITFVYQSLDAAPAVYHCRLDTLELTRLGEAPATLPDVGINTRTATSSDATNVPYTVIAAAGTDLTTPRPTLVYGYGGFNIAHLPAYHDWAAAWIASGGVVVNANLRGGGEFGVSWWEQGRLHDKQHTFDDLYAIAEQLIADGVTTRDQLAVMGGSNGGLLTGAAATQRPDLFSAIVSRVPILDLLRVVHTPVTMAAMVSDYGNPAEPTDAEMLIRHSPYHNVREGTAYPAVLFDAGRNDPRCPAWHARKTAAAMQKATSSDAPILLRVWDDAGHGTADHAKALEQTTDWLAFAMHHTGLVPGTVR